MARVERIGPVTLYLGDGREILPLLGPDLAIVTDPPYGIGYQHGGGGLGIHPSMRRNARQPIIGDAIGFDPGWLLQFAAAAIFGANHWSALPPGGQLVCWDKSLGKGPADSFADGEFAWLLACVRRRRPAIGVEIDPRHFDTACRRVEAEVKAVEAGQPWAKLCDVASFPAKPLP